MRKNAPFRLFAAFVATLITVGSLAACGATASKPTNASEIYAAYLQTDHDNSVITGDITLTGGMGAFQLSFDTTLDLQLNGGNAHGTIASKSGNASMELYSVGQDAKRLTYFKGTPLDLSALGINLGNLTDAQWYVTESDTADAEANITDLANTLDESLFTDATLEENDGTYVVTIGGDALVKQLSAMLAQEDDTTEDVAYRERVIDSTFKNASIKLVFDNAYRVTSISMEPVKASVPLSEGMATTIDLTVGFDLNVSGYDSVGAIEVPAEVASTAVVADESTIAELANAA